MLGLLEQDVVAAPAIEWGVKIDKVNRFIGDILAEYLQIIAVIEGIRYRVIPIKSVRDRTVWSHASTPYAVPLLPRLVSGIPARH